jgi:uncharacterized protein (TIGR02646 family)
MIRVDRSRVPPPAELAEPSCVGREECALAVDFYKNERNHSKSFAFKAYKSRPVVGALNTLFHHKCAYCESIYGATQPVDVEHFRPKGAIAEDAGPPSKPGYYWLAAQWENLLPSCIDCNRQREHRYVQLRPPNGRLSGKANYFPLEDPTRRARQPGDERHERALLLDPCADEPSEHLEFVEGGLVRPALAEGGRESRKGAASIQVFGLRRPGLVQARKALEKKIRARLVALSGLAAALDRGAQPSAFFEAQLSEGVAELREYTREDEPYSAMAKALIEPFFRALE